MSETKSLFGANRTGYRQGGETRDHAQPSGQRCSAVLGRGVTMRRMALQWQAHLFRTISVVVLVSVSITPVSAELLNDQIGFSSNHVFEGALQGETIDLMNGNVNLRIPIGPRYMLNDRFGYQLQLYYNSKIWRHECPGNNVSCSAGFLADSDSLGVGFLPE